ncbi:menaquinone biosynthesis decarboxylase [Bryobacter aggregatus]|uniref:menaquinone biosynthesis decarboxylase n=1 Tax=Bryobacter aggregatus TaxID=360054 RepID=UPI0004E0BBE9|nr:menaquinone biosynthesis decarboxylase [Bryobacter aggregatus]
MSYLNLSEFLSALEKAGELKRIPFEVDPYLEITEFADRAVKSGGPALLFEKPKGSNVPLAINLFASDRRMQIALGVDSLDEIADRITDFVQMKMPTGGLMSKLKMLPMLAEVGSFFPKEVSTGPVKEVIQKDNFSLDDFPILHCWPEDGGRFITLPLVFSKNPATGKRNCGMYRMQVYDSKTTGMHWQLHKQGADHYRRLLAEGKQKRMEVAVAIGADPATMYSAILPLPPEIDEMMVAGFLRSKPVEMVKCETVDLEVPAQAEIVLEGYVELGELRTEGPFGDHTGYYSLEDDYPVFHITAITHRKKPTYTATIVGPPPMEDYWMGKSIERVFLPLMKLQIPEVRNISMPAEGVFHNLMLVSIRKAYPGHARKVMHAIWGLGQAMFTKCIVVVDEEVDVTNYSEVVWKVLNNIDPQRDIEFALGPIDSLDHSSRLPNFGSKMGIDGTKKWVSEGFTRPWPPVITMNQDVKQKIDQMWKQAGMTK